MQPLRREIGLQDDEAAVFAADERFVVVDREEWAEATMVLAKMGHPVGRVWVGKKPEVWKRKTKLRPVADRYFLAQQYGRVIGAAWVTAEDEDTTVIGHGVLPEFRGQKLGSQIRAQVFRWVFRNTKAQRVIGRTYERNREGLAEKGVYGGLVCDGDPARAHLLSSERVWARGHHVKCFVFEIKRGEFVPATGVELVVSDQNSVAALWMQIWAHRPTWLWEAYPTLAVHKNYVVELGRPNYTSLLTWTGHDVLAGDILIGHATAEGVGPGAVKVTVEADKPWDAIIMTEACRTAFEEWNVQAVNGQPVAEWKLSVYSQPDMDPELPQEVVDQIIHAARRPSD